MDTMKNNNKMCEARSLSYCAFTSTVFRLLHLSETQTSVPFLANWAKPNSIFKHFNWKLWSLNKNVNASAEIIQNIKKDAIRSYLFGGS